MAPLKTVKKKSKYLVGTLTLFWFTSCKNGVKYNINNILSKSWEVSWLLGNPHLVKLPLVGISGKHIMYIINYNYTFWSYDGITCNKFHILKLDPHLYIYKIFFNHSWSRDIRHWFLHIQNWYINVKHEVLKTRMKCLK